MNDALIHVMHWLYGVEQRETTQTIAEIPTTFTVGNFEINEALRRLAEKGLVRLDTLDRLVRLTPDGLSSWEDQSFLHLVNGHSFTLGIFRPSIAHIIVRDPDGQEHGASGAFLADLPNVIITAAHVLQNAGGNRTIDRIENETGQVIGNPPMATWISGNADLALIHCPMPENVQPIRIEWREDQLQPLQEVLILGFPPVPHHNAALFSGTGEIQMLPLDYHQKRSILFSTPTRPGCSGGPILNRSGRVIGLVCQEDTWEAIDTRPAHYYRATPAYYAIDLIKQASEAIERMAGV